MLLLDEPTSHLSPALVVVSHDRRLQQRWQGRRTALEVADSSKIDC